MSPDTVIKKAVVVAPDGFRFTVFFRQGTTASDATMKLLPLIPSDADVHLFCPARLEHIPLTFEVR